MAIETQSPVRVFIAEDNPILLQGLERALTANGYEVATAVDGRSLMGLLGQEPLPHVLLLDVMMPGMTGIEVLDAVRADSRTSRIPVILITAAAEEVVPNGALDQTSVEVLMKPFRLSDLLSRIRVQVDDEPAAQDLARDSASLSVPLPN